MRNLAPAEVAYLGVGGGLARLEHDPGHHLFAISEVRHTHHLDVGHLGVGVKEFPESEPEGIVQRYLLALQNRDYPLARTYLKERLKESCTEEYLREASRWFAERSGGTQIALIGKSTLSDGRVEVRVRITEVNVAAPFGVNENSHEERYLLTQENGRWRLDQPAWPVFGCPDRQVPPKPPRPVPAR